MFSPAVRELSLRWAARESEEEIRGVRVDPTLITVGRKKSSRYYFLFGRRLWFFGVGAVELRGSSYRTEEVGWKDFKHHQLIGSRGSLEMVKYTGNEKALILKLFLLQVSFGIKCFVFHCAIVLLQPWIVLQQCVRIYCLNFLHCWLLWNRFFWSLESWILTVNHVKKFRPLKG